MRALSKSGRGTRDSVAKVIVWTKGRKNYLPEFRAKLATLRTLELRSRMQIERITDSISLSLLLRADELFRISSSPDRAPSRPATYRPSFAAIPSAGTASPADQHEAIVSPAFHAAKAASDRTVTR